MKIWLGLICMCVVLALSSSTGSQLVMANSDKLMVGWVEKIRILPENIIVNAKIDTGADNSSLNVEALTEFLRENQRWVRFTIRYQDGGSIAMEKPVHRNAKIRQKGAPRQERPVILMDLCLGKIFKTEVPVNLANRKGFKYPMLIGRSFLEGLAVVDSSLTYIHEPRCLDG